MWPLTLSRSRSNLIQVSRGKQLSLLTILLFFTLGLIWGFWSRSRSIQALTRGTELRVLCHPNWIPTEVLTNFAESEGIRIRHLTYEKPIELVRQLANLDGKIDVVCSSSLLIRSLIESRWIKKENLLDLANARSIAVDFLHLPYDKNSEYSLPLFWNLYGVVGRSSKPEVNTWKQAWDTKRVSIWGEELNLIYLLGLEGIHIEQQVEAHETKSLEGQILAFFKSASQIVKPTNAPLTMESMLIKSDWIQLPLARVARLIGENSPYRFWLPEEGGVIEVGLLSVGENAPYPELAKKLINELVSNKHAIFIHQSVGGGVVHVNSNHLGSIAAMTKPTALREFPLNQFRFPDLNLDALPKFQKVYDGALAKAAN